MILSDFNVNTTVRMKITKWANEIGLVIENYDSPTLSELYFKNIPLARINWFMDTIDIPYTYDHGFMNGYIMVDRKGSGINNWFQCEHYPFKEKYSYEYVINLLENNILRLKKLITEKRVINLQKDFV